MFLKVSSLPGIAYPRDLVVLIGVVTAHYYGELTIIVC